jgi:hypothetical protein
MADTQQTITALKTLLADNTTQQISPQDVRDIVETVRAGYAALYVSAAVESSIGVAGTFVKAAGTTTLVTDPAAVNWSMPANNRLRYDGTADRVVQVVCSISMQAAAANVDLSWRLAKNGTTIAATEITRKVSTGGDNGAAAVSGLVEVTNGDYVELWIANETSTANATVTKMYMSVMDVAL